MIICNSSKGCDRCVACMDGQQSLGGTIVCDTAEELDYDEEAILQVCNFAEIEEKI